MSRVPSLMFALYVICFAGGWETQNNPLSDNWYAVFGDIHASDPLHAWAIAQQDVPAAAVYFLRTQDGGQHWEFCGPPGAVSEGVASSRNGTYSGGVYFLDSLKGWIAYGRELFTTYDGGRTWSVTNPAGVELAAFEDICFADSLHGWIVSQYMGQSRPKILHSEDGGATWVIQDSVLTDLMGVCFLDTLKGFAAGDSGTLLRTTDGGLHWTHVPSGTLKDLSDVQFADSMRGIAVGGGGVVLKTLDGGSSWLAESTKALSYLRDVAYPDIDRVWVASDWVLRSTDGGSTWDWDTTAVMGLYAISFVDAVNGWVCGDHGSIFHHVPSPGIDESEEPAPEGMQVLASPNPASRAGGIRFHSVSAAAGNLCIYDSSGALVRTLSVGSSGADVLWNQEDDRSRLVPGGVYFVRHDRRGAASGPLKIVLLN